jgi:formiminoglutamase
VSLADPPPWLVVRQGHAPLIVSFPHTGVDIPPDIEADLVSSWLGRKDADWWVDRLYDFAESLGATTIRTAISRVVIDVNRDPSGASLYPGRATTELCPTTTFDGEPLYRAGRSPRDADIAERRRLYFDPYHRAIAAEIERLRACHDRVVLYDAHSIRSLVPRLFDGVLPHLNIGANGRTSCDARLTAAVEGICQASPFSSVTDGRFKGGYITRRYGSPPDGVHAIQLELACRGYMDDPPSPLNPDAWPTPYDLEHAAPMRAVLTETLTACIAFARDNA